MRRSPSIALVSLDSPSMSFRSRERAAWPARHIDECTPPVALKERHTPLRSPHTSGSFHSSPSVNSASRRVKVDVAVAATGLKPDHICTTFTPGIRLSTTAGPHGREEVARLLEGGALFRKESGSRDLTCLYVCEGSTEIDCTEEIRRDSLPEFYNVAQLVAAVGTGAKSWVKKAYQGHRIGGTISPLNGARLYSSFCITKIQYFGPTHFRVTLVQDSLLPGISNPQQFFSQTTTTRDQGIARWAASQRRVHLLDAKSASPASSPDNKAYSSRETLLYRSTDRESTTHRTPDCGSPGSYRRLSPAHTKDPDVERRVLRLWEILS